MHDGPFEGPPAMQDHQHFVPAPRRFLQRARSSRDLLLFWVLHHFNRIEPRNIFNGMVALLHTKLRMMPTLVLMWAWAAATGTPSQRRLMNAIFDELFRWSNSPEYDPVDIEHEQRWSRRLFTQPVQFHLRALQGFLKQLHQLEGDWHPQKIYARNPICCQCAGLTFHTCPHCHAAVCPRCLRANNKLQMPAARCDEWNHAYLC